MNNPLTKKSIGVLTTAFILSVAFYGTFLPMRKSQMFIGVMQNLRSQNLRSLRSIVDFENALSVPLDAFSPVGQEELVRDTTSIILGLVQQNDEPEVINELMSYAEKYSAPIVERGRGMGFEQNLYLLGALNKAAFLKTKDVKYLQAAHKYYSQGLDLGPKRPQFLYGMFDIYRVEGNVEGAKAIANQILSQWPNDERVSKGLQEFLDYVQSLTKKK